MPYTLWSRDRLVGESELDFLASTDALKFGDFEPTEFGLSIMPTLTAVRRASLEFARREIERHESNPLANVTGPDPRRTTAYADVAEAEAAFESLELELRAPDGARVDTGYVHVTDMQEVIEFGERRAAERLLRTGSAEMELIDADIDEYDDLLFPDGDDDGLLESFEHDIALLDEMLEKNTEELRSQGHDVPDSRQQRPPARYQIQVAILGAGEPG